MATFKTFEQIDAWQKSRELTKEIYWITGQGTFSRDYGLKDQIRRACVSVMSNIAEGFERSGTGEFTQFLATAKGSGARLDLNFTLPSTRDICGKKNLTLCPATLWRLAECSAVL